MVVRAIFVLLSALAGMALFLRAEDPTRGIFIGRVWDGRRGRRTHPRRRICVTETLIRYYCRRRHGSCRRSDSDWIGGVGGKCGLRCRDLLVPHQRAGVSPGVTVSGVRLGARFGHEQFPACMAGRLEGPEFASTKVLDTSVIIDGRVADLCETGFLEGPFLVPHFILNELQHIADSSDSLKRARGRRGLDILNKIQKMTDVDVRIIEEDFPHVKEVDAKLVVLAKKVGGRIITNDLNLNKVAELQGVRVLNINELCNALRPVVLPGETIRVFVLKEGKEAGQGVAYLDDGTMIVVDNARRCIGRNVDVTVTSVLQTTAGRMIFTRLKEEANGMNIKSRVGDDPEEKRNVHGCLSA